MLTDRLHFSCLRRDRFLPCPVFALCLDIVAVGLRNWAGAPAGISDVVIVGVGLPLTIVVGHHLPRLSDGLSLAIRR